MKILTTSIASAFAAGALVATASAQLPNPVIQYDTPLQGGEPAGPTAVNTGSTAVPGTFINGYTNVTGPDDTAPGVPGAYHFNDGSSGNATLGSGINSGQTLGSVSNAGASFTMAAWVNLGTGAEANNSDNMVFGTNGGQPMHLGFRGGQAYFGFWNNDSNQTTTADPTGAWHEFTWVYDSTGASSAGTGAQKIYEDGVLLGEADGHAVPTQTGEILTVATNGGNNGDLLGSIDDARVYNTAFTSAQAAALYTNMAAVDAVPEPGTWVAAGGLLLLAAGDFRRRLKV